MKKKTIKKKSFQGSSVTLAVLGEKIDRLQLTVEQNTKDIVGIKQTLAYGKGGVRVFVWMVGIVTTIIAVAKFITGNGS